MQACHQIVHIRVSNQSQLLTCTWKQHANGDLLNEYVQEEFFLSKLFKLLVLLQNICHVMYVSVIGFHLAVILI